LPVFAHASESILIDRLKNTVTARCGDINANAITLGFVQDVVSGNGPQDPESAKKEYAKRITGGHYPDWFKEKVEEKKKKACKPSKGKRFAKRVDGKCRSYGQAGQAKSGGDRIRPGTAKGDAYCARSAKIKKCKNPPCANDLSRKKWKCQGDKSVA
jgi:hypothetical protein